MYPTLLIIREKKNLKYNFIQSLSVWRLNQLPDIIFFIWFTFPEVHSMSQSKVSSALCLIENQHTMLSAETSLNKQWREKQTVRENKWKTLQAKQVFFYGVILHY